MVAMAAASDGPCDIYLAHGTPCVAAHSVVRSLFASFDGPLYQIVRTADKKSINISTLAAGGYANAAAQLYGTFRLNFHRFDRFELDLLGHTQP